MKIDKNCDCNRQSRNAMLHTYIHAYVCVCVCICTCTYLVARFCDNCTTNSVQKQIQNVIGGAEIKLKSNKCSKCNNKNHKISI